MRAPGKLNLCLYLGPLREDGLHELCSLFVPISLADGIDIREAERDEVICAGVEQPDLTARALSALRAAGWRGAPVRIEVEKRIPVAAGLGGGSADAAAVLRLARGALADEELQRIAAGLGADVPSQLDPGFALVGGAGEVVTPLPAPEPFAAVLLPDPAGLSTPDVYAEADRLGLGRTGSELSELRGRLLGAAAAGASPLDYSELLVNDLAAAAIALRPSIRDSVAALEEAGAELALVTGSGPTAVGLFADAAAAGGAAERLTAAGRRAIVTGSGILR
jgi:4-diphosphocytidyl-2-C-methyl-D-erythritol kinase